MDTRYAVYLHFELLGAIPKRGNQGQRILKFVRSLAEDPFLEGDFTEKDDSLRSLQIKIVGDYAVTYWVDHPVKCVMIVDICVADT
ncbi:MAG TPA: hypothetical protein VGI88_02040 [Verrucomicrobiae bacterium]|jgi:hypothetical protein